MVGVRGGTATFVLGDVVGSTRLWVEQRDEMPADVAHLDSLVTDLAAVHAGERPIEQGEGDSFVVTFDKVSDAVSFAVDLQGALAKRGGLAVRVGIHAGTAEQRDDGRWSGIALNRCARLRDLGHGGQGQDRGNEGAPRRGHVRRGQRCRQDGQRQRRDPLWRGE